MRTEWIKGYEGRYSVQEDGKVLSHYKNGNIKEIGSQHTSGYIMVQLRSPKRNTYVHRLVAEAFIPNPDNLPVVDHIDEEKTNNSVDNLRWCTTEQNNQYYQTKDGRDYHLELNRKHKEKVTKLYAEIKAEKQANKRLEKRVEKLLEELNTQKKIFEEYRVKEVERITRIKQNYHGYIDTKNMKFESVDAMVNATGKQITVSGQLFPSCGAAASWIAQQEATLGKLRNKDTISKELRKYLQGRRDAWSMYDKYSVGS